MAVLICPRNDFSGGEPNPRNGYAEPKDGSAFSWGGWSFVLMSLASLLQTKVLTTL